MLVLAHKLVANNASFLFKPPTPSTYKTLEDRVREQTERKQRTHLHNSLTGRIYVPYKLHQLRSLAWISVEAVTQQYERVQRGWERMIIWNLGAGLSLAHTRHRCTPRCHKTSCCQSADERVDGRGDRERVVFILHEGRVVRPKAGAAASGRAARRDWLRGLWKLSLGAEEWSRISLLLSHVTVPCVEEYACHPSLTACLGKCNGGIWDSEGLHFSLKLHESAWNVSGCAHQQEVTSCCVMSVNYTQHVHTCTARHTPKTLRRQERWREGAIL